MEYEYDPHDDIHCATCFAPVHTIRLDSHGYVVCDKCDDQKGLT